MGVMDHKENSTLLILACPQGIPLSREEEGSPQPTLPYQKESNLLPHSSCTSHCH